MCFKAIRTLQILQLPEVQWMFFCQNCLYECKFDSSLLNIVSMMTNIHLTLTFYIQNLQETEAVTLSITVLLAEIL